MQQPMDSYVCGLNNRSENFSNVARFTFLCKNMLVWKLGVFWLVIPFYDVLEV